MLRKIFLEAACKVLDCILRPSGKRQDVARAARQSIRPGCGWSFLDDDVRVRAPESKTAHPCEASLRARPGLRLVGNNDSRTGKRDPRVEVGEMQLAGNLIVLEASEYFDETGHTRRVF